MIGRNCSVRRCGLFDRRANLGAMVVVYIFRCGCARLGPAHHHYTNEENSKEVYMGKRTARRDARRGLVTSRGWLKWLVESGYEAKRPNPLDPRPYEAPNSGMFDATT